MRFPGLVVSTPALCQQLGKILAGGLLCFYLNTEKQSKTFWHGVPQIGTNLQECFTTWFTINIFPPEHTSLIVAQMWQSVLYFQHVKGFVEEKQVFQLHLFLIK